MESLDKDEYESSSLHESISDEKNEYNDIMKKEISSRLRELVTKVLTKHQKISLYDILTKKNHL